MRPDDPQAAPTRRSARRAAAFAALACIAAGAAGAVRAGDGGAPARRPGLTFESRWFEAPSPAGVLAADRLLAPHDIGNMRLLLSNAGTLGTAFQSRETPSMEWPARSGIDHLVRGALWIGAVSAATGEVFVTTGGRDANYQEPIFQYSEFTPLEGRPQEYSRLRTSPFYRPGTVADENLYTTFVDTVAVPKEGSEQRHRGMGIQILQDSYAWGFDPLDDFIILQFDIVNVGDVTLQDIWAGIYSEQVINNRNAFPLWPPGGVWFDFQELRWDAERHMLMVRNRNPAPTVSNELRSAIKIVGTGGRGPYGRGPDSLSTKQMSVSVWNWDPSQFLRWTDDSLYARMSTGTIGPLETFEPSSDNNPCTIVAVGPVPLLAPGDTTQVVFAVLAGENLGNLQTNAFWVQKAYDDRYALPAPPSSPVVRVYPRHNEVIVRWSDHPESEVDPASKLVDFQGYRVYLSDSPLVTAYNQVCQIDTIDGIGFDTGLDGLRLPQPHIDRGDTLEYELRLGGIPDGFKRYVSVTSYDWQQGQPPTLESGVTQSSVYFITGPDAEQARGRRVSVFPNPYRGESSFDGRDATGALNPRRRVLWFVNLPQRATVKIFTLAGDLVRTYEHNAATYRGTEAAGISPDAADLSQGRYLVTGGSMVAFDLLSENRQEIATGLYLFSVEDRDTGDTQQGKFLVLK